MQSGKDPDYATGKTKRNGTAGTERSQQTPERNRRYGTQLKDQEQNRQTRYANRKPEPARKRNEPSTVGTEHN